MQNMQQSNTTEAKCSSHQAQVIIAHQPRGKCKLSSEHNHSLTFECEPTIIDANFNIYYSLIRGHPFQCQFSPNQACTNLACCCWRWILFCIAGTFFMLTTGHNGLPLFPNVCECAKWFGEKEREMTIWPYKLARSTISTVCSWGAVTCLTIFCPHSRILHYLHFGEYIILGVLFLSKWFLGFIPRLFLN